MRELRCSIASMMVISPWLNCVHCFSCRSQDTRMYMYVCHCSCSEHRFQGTSTFSANQQVSVTTDYGGCSLKLTSSNRSYSDQDRTFMSRGKHRQSIGLKKSNRDHRRGNVHVRHTISQLALEPTNTYLPDYRSTSFNGRDETSCS